MKILQSILLIAILTSCHKTDNIVGIWERIGDNEKFKGMRILVTDEGDSFKAVILETTDKCNFYGFNNGDLKWKNIKKTAENVYEYEYEGLLKSGSNYEVESSDYKPYYLKIMNDTLIYTCFVDERDDDESTSGQNWVKIKDVNTNTNSLKQAKIKKNRIPYSGNEYSYYSDWKFKVVSKKGSTNSTLILVDENNNPIKYDDELDYGAYDIVEYAFYAQAVYIAANDHDCNGKYYFKKFEDVNSNINLVFNLPIKNEILDEKVKEKFNKYYYDYKKYAIYKNDKGYGYQSFIMINDGQIHKSKALGFEMVTNPSIKFKRSEEGNIQIYWIP